MRYLGLLSSFFTVVVNPLLSLGEAYALPLNESSVLSTVTRRGFIYSYFYKAPRADQPTILFLHGFPLTHHDWAPQITYFADKGYGIIAPDLLGYGGTSAPEDVNYYKVLDVAGDVVDILDHQKVDKVIGVGHDWGSVTLARLANGYIERLSGAAFLSVGYWPPNPDFDFDSYIAQLHQEVGYDVFGYMKFLAEEDAAGVISKHLDSFYDLFFPSIPEIWKTVLGPLGKAKEWIEENKKLPRANWWTAQQEQEHKLRLLQKGLEAPLLWYRGWVDGLNNAADATIPLAAYNLSIPVFYGPTLLDYVDLVSLTLPSMLETCSNLVTHNFNTTHWVMLEAPDEVNAALDQYISTIA